MKDMKKYLTFNNILMFSVYIFIFFILDYLNIRTNGKFSDHGLWLVFANLIINITMAFLSTMLFILSSQNIKRTKKNFKGEHMSEIAVLFGILTYGCTPCVVSFFAALSIPFAVVTLPYAGLPYKFISLGIILIGLALVKRESKKEACEIKLEN